MSENIRASVERGELSATRGAEQSGDQIFAAVVGKIQNCSFCRRSELPQSFVPPVDY